MATIDDVNRKSEEKIRAEEKNPLLKLKLGELVREMQKIAFEDSIVLTLPENRVNEVPEHSMEMFKRYYELSKELDRREEEYKSYKPAPRY